MGSARVKLEIWEHHHSSFWPLIAVGFMIFLTPVRGELPHRQPAITTFPHCRTLSLKIDVVWSLSKWKIVREDSLNVCQGCACICLKETASWKYYIFGSNCGTEGGLIKLGRALSLQAVTSDSLLILYFPLMSLVSLAARSDRFSLTGCKCLLSKPQQV